MACPLRVPQCSTRPSALLRLHVPTSQPCCTATGAGSAAWLSPLGVTGCHQGCPTQGHIPGVLMGTTEQGIPRKGSPPGLCPAGHPALRTGRVLAHRGRERDWGHLAGAGREQGAGWVWAALLAASHPHVVVLVGAVLTGPSRGPGPPRRAVAAIPLGLVALLGGQLAHVADALAVVGLEALQHVFGDSSPFLRGQSRVSGVRRCHPAQPGPTTGWGDLPGSSRCG